MPVTTSFRISEEDLANVTYNADGLVPAIIQEDGTGRVLMLAWMNDASLRKTLETGRTWFWSRSRQRLWKKGETSGHVLKVADIRIDCDQDAVWLIVEPAGPACHTGRRSCFYRRVDGDRLVPVE